MRSVILSGGRSCFVACRGCYNHFARETTDTGTVLSFVKSLKDQFGLKMLTVGGGDPLTRSDIVALLSGLHAMGMRISLDTVGTAFLRDAPIRFMGHGTAAHVDAEMVSVLVDVVGIPLDGSNDEVMRLFRTHSSVSDQDAVLALLDEVGAKVCINTVVHAGNAGDVAEIPKIFSQHPCVRQWQLFQFMPIGPLGWRNRELFALSDSDFRMAASVASLAAPADVKVIAKSAASRKNQYLLIDTAGVVWIPEQSALGVWSDQDTNGRQRLIGRIDDPGVFDRLRDLERAGSAR
jgi:MoaA/NifB/PqqE/SkfB family radical SAM enzyme